MHSHSSLDFRFFDQSHLQIDPSAFIAPGATVLGKVTLAAHVSVWFGSVLRGDINAISVGRGSNIQDLCCLHVADDLTCELGEDCVVAHGAILHGCKIGNGVLIGIGARVLNGAQIGEGSIVAAGAVVPEGKVIPPHTLVMGVPGKIVRETTLEERKMTLHFARKYVLLSKRYRAT